MTNIDGHLLLQWLNYTKNHIETWHQIKPQYWEWTTSTPDEYPANLIAYIDKLAYHNYIIWHHEDLCRTKDPAQIVAAKPIIDRHNQARSNSIEIIDDLLIQHEQKDENVPCNSETLGSIIDRSIILQLKIYHLIELDQTRHKYSSRLTILQDQYQFLSTQATQLLNQMQSGERRIRIFRQLKAYNDPEFNLLIPKGSQLL